jgi:hypothetical protein
MNIAHIASKIVQRPIAGLIPRKDNPRTHNAKQLKTAGDSIRRFGCQIAPNNDPTIKSPNLLYRLHNSWILGGHVSRD